MAEWLCCFELLWHNCTPEVTCDVGRLLASWQSGSEQRGKGRKGISPSGTPVKFPNFLSLAPPPFSRARLQAKPSAGETLGNTLYPSRAAPCLKVLFHLKSLFGDSISHR